MFPVRDLGGMHPVYTGELVDRFEPFDRVQGDPSFELSTITFPLCRHLLSPPPSHIDTAFYLNHLSSFRGTLYLPPVAEPVSRHQEILSHAGALPFAPTLQRRTVPSLHPYATVERPSAAMSSMPEPPHWPLGHVPISTRMQTLLVP